MNLRIAIKKTISLFACLSFTLLLFTACGDEQPYQQYMKAYEQLKEVDSFVLDNNELVKQSMILANLDGSTESTSLSAHFVWKVQQGNAVADMVMVTRNHPANIIWKSEPMEQRVELKSYYQDGYAYVQNATDSTQNYGQTYENDFPVKLATGGIIDFPKSVIAKQSIQDTPNGRLLSFEMDSEKYYTYHFPETAKEYEYGQFGFYREPPLYTVLLDEAGHIKQVNGHFCTVNADDTAMTEERSYTITLTQYGGVELDFPELNHADYPELYKNNQTE